LNDPTIFPVLLVTLIIAIVAYFQNMKWVSGAVLAGSLIYILFFSTSSPNDNQNYPNPETPVAIQDTDLELRKKGLDKRAEELSINAVELQSNIKAEDKEQNDSIDQEENTQSAIVVNEITICRQVSGRQPIGSDVRFPSTVESVVCYTSIHNLNPEKQTVIHEWRLDGELISRIPMEIFFSFNWRCWSQISINADREGIWTVTVKDTTDRVLDEVSFEIISEELY